MRWDSDHKVKHVFFLAILSVYSVQILASGFDFGNLSEDGSGAFDHPVELSIDKTVGTIPSGVKDLKIDLKSAKDLDVRLYDADSGKAVVGWGINALIGDQPTFKSVQYNGVTIKYSGYLGDCPNFTGQYSSCQNGKSPGNEYIHITGVTKNKFKMTAYGFVAGNAKVNYSWKGEKGSSLGGNGSFTSFIKKGNRVILDGILPSGIDNISVSLSASDDIDIELYDAVTNDFVVGWYNESGSAKIHSNKKIVKKYKDDVIEWSGWDGRFNYNKDNKNINKGKEKGIEYIRIYGKSKNSYIMKIYGYGTGNATVDYQWGDNMILYSVLGNRKLYNGDLVDIPYINIYTPDPINKYESYSGIIVNNLGQNRHSINRDGYSDNDVDWVARNINGLPSIVMKFSALNSGGGDVSLFESGIESSSFIYDSLNERISKSTRNKIYLMGHSSGGSAVQGVINKLNDNNRNIDQLFLIDSAGFHGNELVTWMTTYNVPKNVKEAFNFYQIENNGIAWWKKQILNFTTVKGMNQQEGGNTLLYNKMIENPSRGFQNDTESSHGLIDNDPRVWKTIILKIINDYGYKG